VPESDEKFLNLGIVDVFGQEAHEAIPDVTIPEIMQRYKG
jgi:hypothetical protein